MLIDRQRGGFSWYLVIAKRGQERLAKQNLERQGFEVYLPMHAPPAHRGSGALSPPQPRPFLPGYLFVAVDLNTPGWRAIYSTFGVQRIYTTGSGDAARPRALPNRWIEQLQARERDGLVCLAAKDEVRCAFKEGEPVKVRMATADLDAVFLEPVDAKRVAILISLLGRDSRQVVAKASLQSKA